MSKDNLLASINSLFNAIQNKYPELNGNPAEIEATGFVIVNEIAKQMDQGYDISFVKKNPDGSMILNILGINFKPKNEDE